jgi:hypothetical protein
MRIAGIYKLPSCTDIQLALFGTSWSCFDFVCRPGIIAASCLPLPSYGVTWLCCLLSPAFFFTGFTSSRPFASFLSCLAASPLGSSLPKSHPGTAPCYCNNGRRPAAEQSDVTSLKLDWRHIDLPIGSPSPNLVDRMRRLSVSPDTSESFEFVSRTPSLCSVDSHGGGVYFHHGDGYAARAEGCHSDERNVVLEPGKDAFNERPVTPGTHDEKSNKHEPDDSGFNLPKASPYWYQFVGFVPEPSATFDSEFARLAKHQGWHANPTRKHRNKALLDELVFHFGSKELDQMQALCKLIHIQDIPPSITQCRSVSRRIPSTLFADDLTHLRL